MAEKDGALPAASDVGEFSALNLLAEISKQKQIAPDKALWLKNAFVKLHTVFSQSQRNEKDLLSSASKLNDEVKAKKALLEDHAELYAQGKGFELRQELLKASNELAISASRDMELQGFIQRLLEERRVLHDELMEIQQPAAVAADSEMSKLKAAVADCQQELVQRSAELELLRTQRDQRLKRVNEAVQQREQCEQALLKVRQELSQISGDPQRIAKQSDILLLSHTNFKTKLADVENMLKDLQKEEDAALTKRKDTQLQLEKVKLDIYRAAQELDAHQRSAQQHAAQIELNRSTFTDLVGQRALLEAELRRVRKDLKIHYEQSMRLAREKEKGIKALRVLTSRCDQITSTADATQRACQDLQLQLDTRKREAADFASILPAMQKDVADLLRQQELQGVVGSETMATLRESQASQQLLESEHLQAQKDLSAVGWRLRLAQTALAQALNDAMRAESNLERNQNLLDLKRMAIADSAAQLSQLQRSLADTDTVYQVVKTENNKVSSQIATVAQRESEMREKIKVLFNETELMRASILEKDAKLNRQLMQNAASIAARDALRAEAGKYRMEADGILAQKKGAFNDNKNLLDVLSAVDQTTTQYWKELENVQNEKEELSARVQECQVQLAALYDKLHAISAQGRTADLSLQAREDELRFLRLEAAELKRAVEGLRARLPEKQRLEGELIGLQMELLSEQKHSSQLEKSLTEPGNTGRWRQLMGSDPTLEEMAKKIEDVERRLAQKEATALERELVLAETTKLVDRAKKQVDGGRADTLTVAKAVQEYQSKMRDSNRKIMALIAEVSMHQANTLQLQQQVHERQLEVEEANERLSRGEAPTEEALHEWEREIRRENQSAHDAAQRAAEAEGTAPPYVRPNAYMPEMEGELPIARPYGPFAPFKPNEPANNMRHIRKAMVRPVKT